MPSPRLVRSAAITSVTVLAILAGASITDAADGGAVHDPGARPAVSLESGASRAFSVSAVEAIPGGSVVTSVRITNPTAGELRYSLSAAGDDPDGKGLRDILLVTIEAPSNRGPEASCDRSKRTTLYVGPLNGGGFGDAASGANPGDRVLAAGGQELLCVRIAVPLAADNAYQGARTTVAFTSHAEQAAGNP